VTGILYVRLLVICVTLFRIYRKRVVVVVAVV
jgi:hypothetical protein